MEEKDYDSRTALHVASAEGDPVICHDNTVLPHNMCFNLIVHIWNSSVADMVELEWMASLCGQ